MRQGCQALAGTFPRTGWASRAGRIALLCREIALEMQTSFPSKGSDELLVASRNIWMHCTGIRVEQTCEGEADFWELVRRATRRRRCCRSSWPGPACPPPRCWTSCAPRMAPPHARRPQARKRCLCVRENGTVGPCHLRESYPRQGLAEVAHAPGGGAACLTVLYL